MSCPRLEQSVFLHAHGQLQGIQSWLVESHLQRCSVCRAQWAQWTVERDQLRRAFSPMPADPVGLTGLSAAVGARIRTERAMPGEEPARVHPRRSSPSLVAVALAVALLAVAISALAAFWQPVVDHCTPSQQIQSTPPFASNAPGNCPGKLPHQMLNAPAAAGQALAAPKP